MNRWLSLLLLAATLAVAALFCVIVIDEREQAYRTLLNQAEPQRFGITWNRPNLIEPGVYLAIPGIHELHRYDRRSQLFESTPRPLNTVDRTLLETDYYVIWRIVDPRLFYESNGDEKAALARIDEITYGEVRETLNRHSLAELVSPARDAVQKEITDASDAKLAPLGIKIVDVRLAATQYPEGNLAKVYERMRTERARFAMKYRAEGEQQARGLRSKADGDSQVIQAEAEREALRLRGEGDAEAAQIYAQAYSGDPEFYAFVRSLEAYRKSLDSQTTLVLSRGSSFLKYLFDMGGSK